METCDTTPESDRDPDRPGDPCTLCAAPARDPTLRIRPGEVPAAGVRAFAGWTECASRCLGALGPRGSLVLTLEDGTARP